MRQNVKIPLKMKMIPCIKCKEDMPELRLTQYGYKVCVNCSSVSTKRGIPVTKGSGDHTWTETIIMEEDQYESFVNTTNRERGSSGDTVTFKLN